ncbi:MAG: DUF1330 domain-containing protein [Rhodospirillaceae bacterium]|jgi:uncharacterized protein (DUF1330 family)|nr:DUF1330 domain-containing protein [Rhodospirillaceae bacterium]MBT4588619.1 DUF1330 domain-containing protein [Rhodospirillaceae bacterium]MBT4938521.1 DUF1330 domain-containing protein [Rhodospirillaceae bacterium]MBT5939662.1 DUF1330 domain-containing protein [Rhodospirillaceae bacterium]MBT7266276.1 DUF1330 domain-containing protein [Rhodospirillaceae bacterium]
MPAYLIADIKKIHDRDLMHEYAMAVAPMMEAAGAKRIGTSAPVEVLEGSWDSRRVVIFEFSDMTALKSFYHSEAYKPLIAMRQKASDTTLAIIEGVD